MKRSSNKIWMIVLPVGAILLLCAFGNQSSKGVTPFVFDIPAEIPAPHEPVDNPTTVEGVALGKKLFYDKTLSKDHSTSCATCHNPDNYFTDTKEFSHGIGGRKARRNAMPLFNMAWVDNFFWDGRAHALEDVIRFPLTDTNEMGKQTDVLLKELTASAEYPALYQTAFGSKEVTLQRTYRALAQYLRSITSFKAPLDSLYPVASALMKSEHISQPETMRRLFGFSAKTIQTLDLCEKCHSNITYGNNAMRNNGLDETNETDKGMGGVSAVKTEEGLFKAPSFRNLIFTGPYMHDGRFASLEEVLEHYNSGIKANPNLDPVLKDSNGQPLRLNLSQKDKEEILYFLRTLMTDKQLSYN